MESPRQAPTGPLPADSAREHYNRFPYAVGTGGGEVYLDRGTHLGRFLLAVDGGLALDVGCGPGTLLPLLAPRAAAVVGVEISDRSAGLARRAAAAAPGPAMVVQGDALRLPVRSGSADVVVATGSLHHTGDAARGFAELGRVLRPGGRAFVTVYRRASYYDALYRSIGAAARRAHRHSRADLVVNRIVLRPAFWVYFMAGRLAAHRRLRFPARSEVANYFADQLLNPVVSFHTGDELRSWAAGQGLRVEAMSTSHAGALLSAELAKSAA